MTTPAHCRALAQRIQDGDETVTNGEVARALGYIPDPAALYAGAMISPDGRVTHREAPAFLRSVDATRAEWPEGWDIGIDGSPKNWLTRAYRNGDTAAKVHAPTERAAGRRL